MKNTRSAKELAVCPDFDYELVAPIALSTFTIPKGLSVKLKSEIITLCEIITH